MLLRLRHLALLIVTALPAPVPALASGLLPPTELPSQTFASFAECRTELDRRRSEDLAQTTAWTREDDGSLFRRVAEAGSVTDASADEAGYQGRIYTIARFLDGVGIRNQTSYEGTSLTCRGGELTGTRDGGYYLPSLEPRPANGRLEPPVAD